MYFSIKEYNIRSFLHLFLRLHPFSFICMFISIVFKRYRSDDESCEGTNTEDPAVDFEREANRPEDEEDKDMGLFRELERIVAQEDREMKPNQEEMEIVNLGVGNEWKEVKMGICMTAPIHDELVALLRDYQDIFACSYQDMPGLNPDIMQHRLPLNPGCSPVKQKLRRMNPEMSLKIKEEVKRQFDAGFLAVARYPE